MRYERMADTVAGPIAHLATSRRDLAAACRGTLKHY